MTSGTIHNSAYWEDLPRLLLFKITPKSGYNAAITIFSFHPYTRDITLLTKVCIVKAMVFPVVIYGCEIWTTKKAEHGRIDAFELYCWRRFLRVPQTTRRSNQSILKEINHEYSLEGLTLKLKLQYFGHVMQRAESLDEMVGWHHRISGHEFEETQGDSEGQGSLACCSPWGCKESDTTY